MLLLDLAERLTSKEVETFLAEMARRGNRVAERTPARLPV
jgi:hypothetical protein